MAILEKHNKRENRKILIERIKKYSSSLNGQIKIQRKPLPTGVIKLLTAYMLAAVPNRVKRIPRKFWPLVFPKLVINKKDPLHNLHKVKHNVSLMTLEEVGDKIEVSSLALKQAYAGKLEFSSYVMLRTCYVYAMELEKSSAVKGLLPLLEPAEKVLDAIHDRSMSTDPEDGQKHWTVRPCKGTELTTLNDFVSAHRFQLENCTIKELKAAARKLTNQINGGQLEDVSGQFHLHNKLSSLRKETANSQVVINRLDFD